MPGASDKCIHIVQPDAQTICVNAKYHKQICTIWKTHKSCINSLSKKCLCCSDKKGNIWPALHHASVLTKYSLTAGVGAGAICKSCIHLYLSCKVRIRAMFLETCITSCIISRLINGITAFVYVRPGIGMLQSWRYERYKRYFASDLLNGQLGPVIIPCCQTQKIFPKAPCWDLPAPIEYLR